MTSNQQLSDPRLQELEAYAEEIRWTRINELWQSIRANLPKGVSHNNAKNFEKVVIESCKPKPVEPRTLKEIISAAVNKTLRECDGNKALAAKKLGCSRSTVFVHASCIMFLFLASSAFGQSLFALPAPVAAIAPSVQNYGSVTLGWSHPPDKNVTNYSISYGTNRTALNNSVGAGYATNVTITGLEQWQTYYFSGLAYHAAGIASEFSNMVTNFIPPRWRVFSYSTMFETPMLAGRTNVIQSSTNGGVTWRNLHTNTSGGMYRIVRTNGTMPTTEIFRVKP